MKTSCGLFFAMGSKDVLTQAINFLAFSFAKQKACLSENRAWTETRPDMRSKTF
jgi:hypothetical protein